MRKIVFLSVLLLVVSCKSNKPGSQNDTKISPNEVVDLQEIKERGVLRAIVLYSSTSYFLYKGVPMGYEYDLMERLASHLEVDLEIIVAEDIDKELEMLNNNEGDIVAHGLTITKKRKNNIQFTKPHLTTYQALVQKKPENWQKMSQREIEKAMIQDPVELIGKKVHVRKNSAYYERLQNLCEEIGGEIIIEKVLGNISTEEIIKKVQEGEIKYTVADQNIAAINKTYFPDLDISVPVSFSQRIAWAVRKDSPDLLEAVNNWLDEMKDGVDFYVIYNKYFKSPKSYGRRIKSPFFSLSGNKISPYDDIIQKYAGEIKWDWRLLSSQIYQESSFNPNVKSWAGAQGLMQLMPATAVQYNVKDVNNPVESIYAGTKLLQDLMEYWDNIPDSLERIKFVLASYNAGPGHVIDARSLARKYKQDQDKWEYVGEFLRKKSLPAYYNDEVVKHGYCRGDEPYNYVNDILKRYEHYKKFIPLNPVDTIDVPDLVSKDLASKTLVRYAPIAQLRYKSVTRNVDE